MLVFWGLEALFGILSMLFIKTKWNELKKIKVSGLPLWF